MSICFKCKTQIGSDAIHGLHSHCFLEWFGLATHADFKDLDPKARSGKPISPEIEKKIDTFYHGRYLKYSARLMDTSYILKIQQDEYPELPIIEYCSNEIATLLNLDVPPYYLIDFNGKIAFVTRNFMQDYIGTLDHIYKFLPNGEDNYTCEVIINTILSQTGRLSDVAKFIEICLFDTLIGNTDRHGRNLGIITSQGKKLSPMYDNPSTIGIEPDFILKSHYNPSGTIWTKDSKEPKPVDYQKEFHRLGHETIVKHFCMKVNLKSEKILNVISNSNLTEIRKLAFHSLLDARIKDFPLAK
jgi:hypothetical protein